MHGLPDLKIYPDVFYTIIFKYSIPSIPFIKHTSNYTSQEHCVYLLYTFTVFLFRFILRNHQEEFVSSLL